MCHVIVLDPGPALRPIAYDYQWLVKRELTLASANGQLKLITPWLGEPVKLRKLPNGFWSKWPVTRQQVQFHVHFQDLYYDQPLCLQPTVTAEAGAHATWVAPVDLKPDSPFLDMYREEWRHQLEIALEWLNGKPPAGQVVSIRTLAFATGLKFATRLDASFTAFHWYVKRTRPVRALLRTLEPEARAVVSEWIDLQQEILKAVYQRQRKSK